METKEAQCPKCKETLTFEYDFLSECTCPNCKTVLEWEYDSWYDPETGDDGEYEYLIIKTDADS